MLLRSCCDVDGERGLTTFLRPAAERELAAELGRSCIAVAVAAEPGREEEAVKSGIEEDTRPDGAVFCCLLPSVLG